MHCIYFFKKNIAKKKENKGKTWKLMASYPKAY